MMTFDNTKKETKDQTPSWAKAKTAETKAETAPTEREKPVVNPVQPEPEKIEPNLDTVIVTVPKAYKLCIVSGEFIEVKAGVQRLSKQIAEHWYSKVNGVQEFKE